jgi:hypothetical protein
MNKYALSASGPWAATCMLLRGVIHPGGNTDEPFNSSSPAVRTFTSTPAVSLYTCMFSFILHFSHFYLRLTTVFYCVLLFHFLRLFFRGSGQVCKVLCHAVVSTSSCELNRLTGFSPF